MAYQDFRPEDCGNCWLMGATDDNPYYCNKRDCEPDQEQPEQQPS